MKDGRRRRRVGVSARKRLRECVCVHASKRERVRESHFIVIVFNIYWKNVKKM